MAKRLFQGCRGSMSCRPQPPECCRDLHPPSAWSSLPPAPFMWGQWSQQEQEPALVLPAAGQEPPHHH